MFGNAYNGKKVLVTGHTGFKGSWMTMWLLELGASVCGLAKNIPTDPANFIVQDLEKDICHIKGDVRRLDDVINAFEKFRPDIVFHLAAQPLVRKSYEDPTETFETNVMGTLNILEAIRHFKEVQAGVMITSDKCYHNSEWTWGYRETDQLGGEDPYSGSKGCAEIIINSYRSSYLYDSHQRIASTRAGNVIGGGDWAEDRIIPDCIRAWSKGQSVVIRNPNATRPWQHVFEPLSGYLWLGANLMTDASKKYQEAFNFGPLADSVFTVESVLQNMARFMEKAVWEVEKTDDSKKESTLLKLCCDKALHVLDWQPVLMFEETIELTARWYDAYYSGSDESIRKLSKDQLLVYMNKARKKGLKWAQS